MQQTDFLAALDLPLIVGQRTNPHAPDPIQPPAADDEAMYDGRDRRSYEVAERRDLDILDEARIVIERRGYAYARQLLERVHVLTWQRDRMLADLERQAERRAA